MAGNILTKYGINNQAITCTLASLANNGQRSSTAISNTANLFIDALVQIQIKSAAASTSATGYVNIYAYGTVDGGTTYGEAAGTDAGITLTSPPNVRLIGVLNVVANATTYKSNPMSVAEALGGALPDHWGSIIQIEARSAL